MTRDGGSRDWPERRRPRRSGRHSRAARDYADPDPYAAPDADAQADPYPPADPAARADPYAGQPGRGAHTGRNGQADPYGQAGRNGQSDPYGGRGRYADPDPYARRDPNAARDLYAQQNPYAAPDPFAQTDPRYSGQPSAQRPDPRPPRDGYGPRAPHPPQDYYAPPDTTAGPEAYGQPGAYPRGEPDGQGRRRRDPYGEPAGYEEPSRYGRTDSYGQPGGGSAPDYGQRSTRGERGPIDELDAYPGAALPGAEDRGPFRWRPPPDATGPQALPAVPGYSGGGIDHEPPPPGHGDWDAGPEPGGPAGLRRGQDAGGADLEEPGSGSDGGERWPYGAGEPAEWDDPPAQDGLIPGFGERGDSRRGRGSRPRRRIRRVLAPVLAPIVVVVVLIALGAGGYKIYKHFQSPDYSGPGFGDVTVQVLPGDTAESLGPRLVQLGVVASTSSFVSAVKQSSCPTCLQPGFFRLHKHMNSALAYKLLLAPASRIQNGVTIPEGLRLTQILSRLEAAKSPITASAYAKALKDTAALGLPSYANRNPEGYLFPATYDISPGMSATSVLQAMVARFKQEAASISLPQAAAAVHLTPGQVITVASILEAEGGNPKYYSRVAEVIYNRLSSSMFLGLDSTVNYALHRFGISLTNSQLAVNSPYNTFLHKGLPPGPIDSPGDAAIQAALHPAHGNLTYFVTVNLKTGLTLFTNDPAVFDQYVALCRKNGAC